MITHTKIACLIGGVALCFGGVSVSAHTAQGQGTQSQGSSNGSSMGMSGKKFDGSQYLNEAKVKLNKARKMALKAYPGVIQTEELEKEAGGHGLRYSFVIKASNGTSHEVGIDAADGTVLENAAEGPNAD